MARRMASISSLRSGVHSRQFAFQRGQVGANPVELTRGSAARFQHRHALPDVRRGALGLREAVLLEVVGMLVGAVGDLVSDRLRVRPQPGDRPEQPAEGERQQAERPDRLELRVVPLVGDLLGQHVHHPEQDDEQDRHEEQDEDGDIARHRVFDFGGHQRRLRRAPEQARAPLRQRAGRRKRPARRDASARHGIERRRMRHKDLCFDLSTPRATAPANGTRRTMQGDAGCRDASRRTETGSSARLRPSGVPSDIPGTALRSIAICSVRPRSDHHRRSSGGSPDSVSTPGPCPRVVIDLRLTLPGWCLRGRSRTSAPDSDATAVGIETRRRQAPDESRPAVA